MPQLFFKIVAGKTIQDVQAIGQLLLKFYLRANCCFFDLYIVLIGQPFQRFYIGVFLMLHQKTDGIPTSSTTKTFVNFFGRRNRKGRRLFSVKWTQAEVIGTALFKFNELADDLNYIDPALNLLYGLLTDHVKKVEGKDSFIQGVLKIK